MRILQDDEGKRTHDPDVAHIVIAAIDPEVYERLRGHRTREPAKLSCSYMRGAMGGLDLHGGDEGTDEDGTNGVADIGHSSSPRPLLRGEERRRGPGREVEEEGKEERPGTVRSL